MRRFRAALALVFGLAAAAQSWSTFYSAYDDGLKAQARGEWGLAARAFARAVVLEPRPGRRLRTYGLNFLPAYHPYLHLAECGLAQGDLGLAERALADSERYGLEPASLRDALRARLEQARASARAAAAGPPPDLPAPQVSAPMVPARLAQAEPSPGRPSTSVPEPAAPPDRPPRPRPALPPGPGPSKEPAPTRPAPPPGEGPGPAPPSRAKAAALLGGAALAAAGAAGWLASRGRRAPRTLVPLREADLGAGMDTVDVAPDPNLGRRFGPYRVLEILGRGGCATAYLAEEEGTGRRAALKVPHANLAADPGFQLRFRREAALGRILDHPGIVKVLDPGPEAGPPWLALEYVPGGSLEARLRRQKPLSTNEAAAIARDVAEALRCAHLRGVVHRDLKPANILLGPRGAVVSDFGVARVLDAALTATALFIGTPAYCAPECIASPKVGPAADRYALGIILFEMLTGEPPFTGDTHFQVLEAHRSRPLPSLRDLRPDLPAPLVDLVERLCAKDPEARPEDGEVVERLGTWIP